MNNENLLYDTARKAAMRAYAPYSKFKVGCAILSSNGNIYSGCNVENVSYPCGTCAEAGAISSLICNGDNKIAAILIYADGKELIKPCGACRQRIAEFSDNNTLVYLADATGIKQKLAFSELFPQAFKEF